MKTTYKIIGKGASTSFWIKKETVFFWFIKCSTIIGDYKIDDTHGELGQMPFFCKKEAKKRLKLLQK
tara:strand:- start:553 stop:753 length:201 start_codon:yes stop_codon:yes gene_type:complete